ncbi:copper chaperone PCu(A)C [Pseudorhodoferax sp.]|uniref:copper chaperone PCu(A)C n=1 Tax=Pseudorhodoferax sp. TaxID=1993553 RepID=UPI002DD62439|nr:copper chaperone PCu(A)C [Pseudorhodoferax sp.]
MRSMVRPLALACALLAAAAAQAQVGVHDAWVRASVPQQKATGAFMQLQAAQDSRLVGVSSPAAPVVEVHEMVLQDGIMRMRAVPALALPAGKTVELKPGGYHVMLMDLPQQLKQGDTVPLTLVFEGKDGKRQTVEVKAPVRPISAAAPAAGGHGGHGSHTK